MVYDDAPAMLHLDIEAPAPLNALEVGRLFIALSAAFAAGPPRPLNRESHQRALRLESVHSGSLVANFVVICAAISSVEEGRAALVALVRRFIRAARIMAGAEEGKVTKADHEVVSAASEVVTSGGGRSLTINVHGNNAHVFFINSEQAASIKATGRAADEIGNIEVTSEGWLIKTGGRRQWDVVLSDGRKVPLSNPQDVGRSKVGDDILVEGYVTLQNGVPSSFRAVKVSHITDRV